MRGASPGDTLVPYGEPPRRPAARRWPYSIHASHADQRAATDDPDGNDTLDERTCETIIFLASDEHPYM